MTTDTITLDWITTQVERWIDNNKIITERIKSKIVQLRAFYATNDDPKAIEELADSITDLLHYECPPLQGVYKDLLLVAIEAVDTYELASKILANQDF